MNLSPIQLRALRNAVIGGSVTAIVGFAIVGVLHSGGGASRSVSPSPPTSTPSPPPVVCSDAFEAVPSADPNKKADALLGVVALASDDAWAVGSAGPRETLIEHWDGTSWGAVDSPIGNLRHNVLNGVAGIAPTDVWAVGASTLGAQSQVLIEHWDGFSWSLVQAPGDLPPDSTLSAVATVSADDVWAVGASGDTQHGRGTALVLHWNGQLWSLIPPAQLSETGGSFLLDVAAAGPTVWALGYVYPTTAVTFQSEPLIERWDGSAWVEVPNAGTTGSSVFALGVTAPDSIWAAGNPIQVWNGQAWTLVRSPRADLADLRDVAVIATDDAWAVGFLPVSDTENRALIEHWDGQRWKAVSLPASDDASQTLSATAAFAGGGVWAVGSRVPADGSSRTLILSRSCGVAPPT